MASVGEPVSRGFHRKARASCGHVVHKLFMTGALFFAKPNASQKIIRP